VSRIWSVTQFHRLIQKESETQVEATLRALAGRMDTLDLQVQQLTIAVDQAPAPLQ